MKANKKGVWKYSSGTRKFSKSVCPLVKGKGKGNGYFFNLSLQEQSLIPDPSVHIKTVWKEAQPTSGEQLVGDCLRKVDVFKSTELDEPKGPEKVGCCVCGAGL